MPKADLSQFALSDENFDVNPFNMKIGGEVMDLDALNELHQHFQDGNLSPTDYIQAHSEILRQNPELSMFRWWCPLPGPQLLALLSKADELYYGGSAGGGKTDLLIGLALTMHKKSIIFRREYPQLQDVVARTTEIIGKRGNYNSHSKLWRGLPDKRTIELGAVATETDLPKYRGRPHDLKGFDELPEFSELQYLFLSGWLRSPDPSQRTRIVGAGNPPTNPEGWWVVKRWAPWLDPTHSNPAKPGELRWYIRVDDADMEVEDATPVRYKGEIQYPKSRTFLPARLDDNPFLSATSDYRSTLQRLPEPLRSQLLYGDFSLGISDDPWQVIPTSWLQAANERWKQINREADEYVAGIREEPPSYSKMSSADTLGADIARGGKAQTVLTPRSGNYFHPQTKVPGKKTPDGESAKAQVVLALKNPLTIVVLDILGVGSSAYDKCVEAGLLVEPFDGSKKSKKKDRSGLMKMRNKRAEAYWKIREGLDPTSNDPEDLYAIPPDPELVADLTAPRWKSTPQGIQIEEKEELSKRLGRSPDCGDSLVYAAYIDAEASYMGMNDAVAVAGNRDEEQGSFEDLGLY